MLYEGLDDDGSPGFVILEFGQVQISEPEASGDHHHEKEEYPDEGGLLALDPRREIPRWRYEVVVN
ncbi:MAG TPA: hypothetical protein VND40_00370 [Nitrososphaerales archaeon]|nr:hypothetical protein [Nitrososphaerales archaeon]